MQKVSFHQIDGFTFYVYLYYIVGEDFSERNTSLSVVGSSSEELLIEILEDGEYEGSNEKFMVLASIEPTFNGRVQIQPSFVEIEIENSNPRPGRYCVCAYAQICVAIA